MYSVIFVFFFFSSRRRHTRCSRDWSSDVCSSDLVAEGVERAAQLEFLARCGPIGVQGFLLGKPVEASLAAAEARAAAVRARQALENAAFAPRRDAGAALGLFGSSGPRRASRRRASPRPP